MYVQHSERQIDIFREHGILLAASSFPHDWRGAVLSYVGLARSLLQLPARAFAVEKIHIYLRIEPSTYPFVFS